MAWEAASLALARWVSESLRMRVSRALKVLCSAASSDSPRVVARAWAAFDSRRPLLSSGPA